MVRLLARTRHRLVRLAKEGVRNYLNYKAVSAALKTRDADLAAKTAARSQAKAHKQQTTRAAKLKQVTKLRYKKQRLRTRRHMLATQKQQQAQVKQLTRTKLQTERQQAAKASKLQKLTKVRHKKQRVRERKHVAIAQRQEAQVTKAYESRKNKILARRKRAHLTRIHRQNRAADRLAKTTAASQTRQTAKITASKAQTKLKLATKLASSSKPSQVKKTTPATTQSRSLTQLAKATGKKSSVLRAKNRQKGAAALQAAMIGAQSRAIRVRKK